MPSAKLAADASGARFAVGGVPVNQVRNGPLREMRDNGAMHLVFFALGRSRAVFGSITSHARGDGVLLADPIENIAASKGSATADLQRHGKLSAP